MINNDDNFNKELFDLHFSLKKKIKKLKKIIMIIKNNIIIMNMIYY